MKYYTVFLLSFWVLLGISFQSVSSQQASLPPRGWNSYDSFLWTISEEEFLQNAEIVAQRLRTHGYEYVVLDYLWYRKLVQGSGHYSYGFDGLDEWGRMVPDPVRFPSSKGGKGLTEVANKVHSLGLKFGLHIMRGISAQAVAANTPILDTTTGRAYEEGGRVWRAKDIAIPERACQWMPKSFMSVNTNLGAGKAFLRSLHEQYASWGVDFLKHDCVFGDDLDLNEVTYVSELISNQNRTIVYSLSPGTSATPEMAKAVSGLANMYRITGDDWDEWSHVKSHFNVSRDFATADMIGTKGLKGNSWPDLDMLPFGWISKADSNKGPHRFPDLTLDEQKTQMTLWAMAKSPIMYGGDLRKIDVTTFELITNPVLLEINHFSSNNLEFPYITSSLNLTTTVNEHQSGNETEKPKKGKKGSLPIHTLAITSCTDTDATGWTTEGLNLETICWKKKLHSPFCVNKKELAFKLDQKGYEKHYRGKYHLVQSDENEFCLEASPKRKVFSNELERGTFSPCTLDSNQIWKLNPNGTLVNSYSGNCATVKHIEAETTSPGVRSWIAKGRKGEVYLAFFNLSEQKTTISAKTTYLTEIFPKMRVKSCRGKEVWSGKAVVTTNGALSMDVAPHASALLLLKCH